MRVLGDAAASGEGFGPDFVPEQIAGAELERPAPMSSRAVVAAAAELAMLVALAMNPAGGDSQGGDVGGAQAEQGTQAVVHVSTGAGPSQQRLSSGPHGKTRKRGEEDALNLENGHLTEPPAWAGFTAPASRQAWGAIDSVHPPGDAIGAVINTAISGHSRCKINGGAG